MYKLEKRKFMKLKTLLGIVITLGVLTSCENLNNKKKHTIDYSNKVVLDSLIKKTPHSSDTLFLGFTIGMTKSEYKKQINKLRHEGKKFSYSSTNTLSTIVGTFELGAGYTFITSITSEKAGKILTGKGQYFLEPSYNKSGNLIQLNIFQIEKWEGYYGLDKPNWLKTRVQQNSERLKDQDLRKALIENEIINQSDFVRQKDNLVIYENDWSVNYIDLKTLLLKLLKKEKEKELIKEKNKDLKF